MIKPLALVIEQHLRDVFAFYPDMTITQKAQELKIGRATLYNYVRKYDLMAEKRRTPTTTELPQRRNWRSE